MREDAHISDSEQIESDDDSDLDVDMINQKFAKQIETVSIPSRDYTTVTATISHSIPSTIPQLTPETERFMNLIFTTPTSTIPPPTYTSEAHDVKDDQIASLQANVDALNAKFADLESTVNSQLDLLNDLTTTNSMQQAIIDNHEKKILPQQIQIDDMNELLNRVLRKLNAQDAKMTNM
ncbi:hypothetical protein L1987_15550 [Smallanthus sonchifolius]|uniref:Uncharacterized protein n=1 Tax=Smallanthus sonchifolius TaxID=185202 RepID=A0ACB9J6W4_9ASTR|nr:hypothetical protein L1987_15550 [Smallanthus sonchifolius]